MAAVPVRGWPVFLGGIQLGRRPPNPKREFFGRRRRQMAGTAMDSLCWRHLYSYSERQGHKVFERGWL